MAASLDHLADLEAAPRARGVRPWRPALARLATPSVELFSAWAMLGWSALLLLKPTLFESAPGYAAMALLGEEGTWALVMAAVGSLQLGAIATRHPILRLLGCGGACATWAFVAVMLSQVAGVRTGCITYGLLSFFLLWRNLKADH